MIEKEVVAEIPEVVTPQEEPKPVVSEEKEETGPIIENIKAEKLEGPKILGKIQLPIGGDNRPKPQSQQPQAQNQGAAGANSEEKAQA
ncbi:hypothetical protein [Paraflavitalea speifideaquila]|uniref:hypothetical protein n=1 Tax=Paraflavitalea speifideaquila TaxID=3076558 RepID=UPI0028EC17FD|nr:hypothetical protein [Paraflavitalea speifideiaquila]